jgi:hypothetical protein
VKGSDKEMAVGIGSSTDSNLEAGREQKWQVGGL